MGHQLQPHFLLVTYPAQGHINPTLNLAKRLAAVTGGRVTFCTSVYAHRRMFPAAAAPDQEVEDGLLSYIPFTDGYDDGVKDASQFNHFMANLKDLGTKNLSTVVGNLADRGRPVTCIIYTLFVPWGADLARKHGIPSVPLWIQPATVLIIYYHFFHGYDAIVTAHKDDPTFVVDLPGLPPLRIKDMPTFCLTSSDDVYYGIFAAFRDSFMELDREEAGGKKQRVIVNTFEALEAKEIEKFKDLELKPVGPLLPLPVAAGKESAEGNTDDGHLIKPDEKKYTEWLDTKAEGAVVYVSFGSYSVLKKEQMEELSKGLEESGRAYLWVVRKENREGVELVDDGEKGLVVEWCSQVKVLSHSAVGCFVTHCGWNSTIESLGCGVPVVGVPLWTDQTTNAWLAEKEWRTGVAVEKNGDGLVEGGELRRCLDLVMGEGEKGADIRRRAKMWRDLAVEAVSKGGSSDANLRALVEE